MRNLLKILQLKKLSKLLLFMPLFFMANCEKDPSLPGIPGGDKLTRLDSTVLVAFTLADKVKDALNEGDVVIGKLEDPRSRQELMQYWILQYWFWKLRMLSDH
jgi:hypothetical protein